MPLAQILPLAGALCAPAFFLIMAFASFGAVFLALVCLTVGQLRSTQHPEAYARRLLRMALSTALPALLVFIAAAALAALRLPWLLDWLLAAPLEPGLFAVALLAYCASLVTLRFSHAAPRHRRQNSPLLPALILTLLAVFILWLGAMLFGNLLEQFQAVLSGPTEDGIGVARLIAPDAIQTTGLNLPGLAALVALCMACGGAASLEYLLLLRDREPFGREALCHILRLAARATLRSALLAGAMLPVFWLRLSEAPLPPESTEGLLGPRILLGISGAACLLLCLCVGLVARNKRPWDRGGLVHASLLLIWLGLTALLAYGLLRFYTA